MVYDISSLTTDPTKRGQIMAENNNAIIQTAAQAQNQLRELETTSRKLNTARADKEIEDLIFNQNEAGKILQTSESGTTMINQLHEQSLLTQQTLSTQIGRMTELRQMLDDPNFHQNQDRKTRNAAQKEFNKLDKEAYKTYQMLQTTRGAMAAAAQTTAQLVDIQTQEFKIRSQARDQVAITSQVLDLENKLMEIETKFKNDNALLGYVTQRQMLSAQEVAEGNELDSDINRMWWEFTNNGENKDIYGASQAKQMRDLRRTLGPAFDQAVAKVFPTWLRSHVAGVPLTMEQYKLQLAHEGDADSLEAFSLLVGDNDVTETIQLGRTTALNQKIADYTKQAEGMLEVGQSLTSAQVNAIRQQAENEVAAMRAADFLKTAGQVVNSEMRKNASAKGQDLLSGVAENLGDLLNPQIYGQELRDWFKTPEVQAIVRTPNSEDGSPLATTAFKLVEALNRSGFTKNEQESIRVVSDLVKSAGQADYKVRNDLGTNEFFRESRALERLGFDTAGGVVAVSPTRSKLRDARQYRNLDDPTDLALQLQEIRTYRKGEGNLIERMRNETPRPIQGWTGQAYRAQQ